MITANFNILDFKAVYKVNFTTTEGEVLKKMITT